MIKARVIADLPKVADNKVRKTGIYRKLTRKKVKIQVLVSSKFNLFHNSDMTLFIQNPVFGAT